ncbi:MAG: 16S rRNA (cytidine(1402)-2'-O)-methyltransferase [Vigna little leaf phytoplasma]|nr:16S rRNA (cytidine(1402)-2'-O)-methyltransferase [Vigna little leaf phytoplasma]
MRIQHTFINAKAILYLVATPIGNIADLSFRAVQILKEVSYILAEDTRRSKIILDTYGIKNKIISLNQYNEQKRLYQVLEWLKQGKNLALISDSGTPLISDPGFILVREIQKSDFHVTTIPGASAFLAAFTISAFSLPFVFLGFLPKKNNSKIKTLIKYRFWTETLIFYESPKRVLDTLILLKEYFPCRKIVLMKELTKKFETLIFGTIEEILKQNLSFKGEYVLVIEGCKNLENYQNISLEEAIIFWKHKGLTEKETFAKISQIHNFSKKDIYHKYKIQSISKKEKEI